MLTHYASDKENIDNIRLHSNVHELYTFTETKHANYARIRYQISELFDNIIPPETIHLYRLVDNVHITLGWNQHISPSIPHIFFNFVEDGVVNTKDVAKPIIVKSNRRVHKGKDKVWKRKWREVRVKRVGRRRHTSSSDESSW